MIFLNTFWTSAYILMLAFVFWLALLLYGRIQPPSPLTIYDNRKLQRYKLKKFLFAVLATFFFHSVW